MVILSDYHMHTPLCGHAVGEPDEYAAQAVKVGLKEIGFSDHAPFVHYVDPTVTMDIKQLPQYHKMIEDVQKKYQDQLTIKIALEADFIPEYEDKTKAIINSYPYDYVIGSVHFIKDWGFDHPDQREKWDEQDTDAIYKDYYELLQKSAQTKMFNIIGHADLVKKFGNRAKSNMQNEVQKTADIFKETNIVVEINTAGLRKPVKEIYPSLWDLKIYCEANVPITFGSDAHSPKQVGMDYDKAFELAQAAGYKEYVTFKQGKIEKTLSL